VNFLFHFFQCKDKDIVLILYKLHYHVLLDTVMFIGKSYHVASLCN